MQKKHKLFAIFGNPVNHSISPLMHNYALKGLHIEGCYTRYRLENANQLKEKFLELSLEGINVTVPHKEAAFAACDEIKGIAKDIGAVNTIINHHGKLIGYNTDAPGFYKSASSFGKIHNILILGAGGTAKALAAIFRKNNVEVHILNRSSGRLDFFKDRDYTCSDWDDFQVKSFDLVVNTTSAGLQDDHLPAPENILHQLLKQAKYAMDVIYNKNTPFLQIAKTYNMASKDGSEMLRYQGVYAFELFFDYKYKEDEIDEFMQKAFA